MARFQTTPALLAATLALGSFGCAIEVEPPTTDVELSGQKAETKPIPWGSRDDPDIFAGDLVYKLDELPTEGGAATPPWASSYWPTYQDALNYKWEGPDSLSPAAKYGEAFGIEGVEDAVSRYHGIESQSHRTECTETSDCDSDLGESCAKRDGEEEGHCIPTWFGICHAWAPASILQPEAVEPVTVNGVEFKVNDIKALVTLVYNRTSSKFASRRCNENNGAGDIEYDEYGRPKSGDCIDTNPGTFHLLLANFLGLRQQSFVYDRTYDYQVWNQPLRDFRITEMNEVSGLEANQLIGVTTVGARTTELEAEVPKDEWHHFEAVEVAEGETIVVRMTGTGDGDLHARFGEQPTPDAYDCRPYAGGSTEECELTAPAGATQLFVSVHGYSEAEVSVNVMVGGETPDAYIFNDDAVSFYEVRSEVRYISESSSSTDGNLADDIDRYTHTDRYHYVLEVDSDGRIVGGEWLGSSKTAHPDFLWLPTGNAVSSVAGGKIRYSEVINILNQSIAGDEGGEGEGESEDVEVNESGSVTKGQMLHFGPYSVAEGTSLVATITGDGDADVYVRRGAAPTASSFDCRPYQAGSAEECTVAGPGQIYVGVEGYADLSNFELRVQYTTPGSDTGGDDGDDGDTGGDDGDTGGSAHLNESGSVAQGEFAYFTLEVEAGQDVVVRTEAANDVDLYVQFGHQPTTSDYAGIGYTASGNEEVLFSASASGTLHIGVHGYAASDFVLTTAAP